MASASMMSEAVKGQEIATAQALQQHFRAVLTGEERARRRPARQAGQPGRRAPLPQPHQMRAAGLARADACHCQQPGRARSPGIHGRRNTMMKRMREDVLINRRAVTVERIPDGTPMDLPGGLWAQVTQALGSNFTLVVEGQLVRLKGSDADAIGKEPPAEARTPRER
jgi:hypothetical protein